MLIFVSISMSNVKHQMLLAAMSLLWVLQAKEAYTTRYLCPGRAKHRTGRRIVFRSCNMI